MSKIFKTPGNHQTQAVKGLDPRFKQGTFHAGTVKTVKNFGAFIRITGVPNDGLLRGKTSFMLEPGDEVQVKIKKSSFNSLYETYKLELELDQKALFPIKRKGFYFIPRDMFDGKIDGLLPARFEPTTELEDNEITIYLKHKPYRLLAPLGFGDIVESMINDSKENKAFELVVKELEFSWTKQATLLAHPSLPNVALGTVSIPEIFSVQEGHKYYFRMEEFSFKYEQHNFDFKKFLELSIDEKLDFEFRPEYYPVKATISMVSGERVVAQTAENNNIVMPAGFLQNNEQPGDEIQIIKTGDQNYQRQNPLLFAYPVYLDPLLKELSEILERSDKNGFEATVCSRQKIWDYYQEKGHDIMIEYKGIRIKAFVKSENELKENSRVLIRSLSVPYPDPKLLTRNILNQRLGFIRFDDN